MRPKSSLSSKFAYRQLNCLILLGEMACLEVRTTESNTAGVSEWGYAADERSADLAGEIGPGARVPGMGEQVGRGAVLDEFA